jgi:hypothetical protein
MDTTTLLIDCSFCLYLVVATTVAVVGGDYPIPRKPIWGDCLKEAVAGALTFRTW